MMTQDQFFELEKDNPHDHIRWDSPSVARKRIPSFYSHLGGSCFQIHEFFPPQEQQISVRKFLTFNNDTFYNALNLTDQDSWNSTADGNVLERCTHDVLTIIENKSKVRNSQNKSIVSQVKSSDANSSSSSEIAKLTHAVNQQTSACLATDGKTFLELRDNIQGYVAAAAVNYNQGNSGYRPLAVILKKLPEKLRDPGKFLIPYGFSELKCKALANLGASINLMPLSIWKKLGLPELISTCMTLELANRTICTPAGIARDVFVLVGKFTFPIDFVIYDYESDPRVPLILGRPFLRTARALIDVHREEMILRDGDERPTLNMRHDTSSYSNQPQKESINMINIFNDSCKDFLEDLFATNHQSGNPTFSSHPELTSPKVKDDVFDSEGGNVLIEKLLNLDSTKDLPPPYNINFLSGSTTSSSNQLLEEFADELALITFPPGNDDLLLDIESDLKEIEYLLNHDPIKDMDSILEDSIDESNLVDLNDNLVDTMPEMFIEEHALDYSSPSLYDDDLFKVESGTKYVYDDPFDSKGEKIKESKLLIDELDLPRSSNFLPSPEYDSFLFDDFFEIDALPSTNNEDKKISISHASLILEVFDPPLSDYELLFHKEVPSPETLLSFSSENVEKVFKPEILTYKEVHSSLLSESSHRDPKAFKVTKIVESPMQIFPCSFEEDIRILDVPCLPELISSHMTLELTNQAICTPAGIARDVLVSIGKFRFPADFIIVDYESDPRVPLILGTPILWTARALIDVHGEEMILHDGDERLTLNMRHDTSSYSNQPKKESINMINIFNDSSEYFLKDLFAINHLSGNPTFSSHSDLTSLEVKDDIFDLERGNVLIEKLLNLDSTKDLPPHHNINPLSGSTTSSSPNHLLEEFADEFALITFPPGNDDLPFDIESDLKEIEYLLNHDPIKDMDSILKDLVDEDNLEEANDNLVDTMSEMFTDEHSLDY
nr:reverse transcriptase domain-containing protein [Tanacetum cinerariifolium]